MSTLRRLWKNTVLAKSNRIHKFGINLNYISFKKTAYAVLGPDSKSNSTSWVRIDESFEVLLVKNIFFEKARSFKVLTKGSLTL